MVKAAIFAGSFTDVAKNSSFNMMFEFCLDAEGHMISVLGDIIALPVTVAKQAKCTAQQVLFVIWKKEEKY